MSDEQLRGVGDTWERLANIDPLWAVLSEPDKQGRKWDLGDFLRTGELEIGSLLGDLEKVGFNRFSAALDFGCGVGRLTQPLSRRFSRAIGVDISPTMVERARELARDNERATFVVNDRPDLSLLEDATFDLVYSNIVLQHMPPDLARGYLNEFFRVVRPGGFVVFQIPSHLTDDWLPGGNNGTQLAEGLHKAEIAILDSPARMTCHEDATVRVRVRNVSPGVWLQDLTNQINLGNHWMDRSGAIVAADDGRVRIPGRVHPSEVFVLELPVRAPNMPGSYAVEVDLVQEGVTWFATRGSSAARSIIEVVAAPGPTPLSAETPDTPVDVKEYPTFMMHGIVREEIEKLVQDLGGQVLEARPHVEQWVSYRYLTRRDR